jgi:hypothetical protein
VKGKGQSHYREDAPTDIKESGPEGSQCFTTFSPPEDYLDNNHTGDPEMRFADLRRRKKVMYSMHGLESEQVKAHTLIVHGYTS